MKNLPGYIILATFTSLVLLVVVASFGVPLPVFDLASQIVGYAAAASVLAIFITDVAPRSGRITAAAVEAASEKVSAALPRHVAARDNRPAPGTLAERAMATLNVVNDPATVSIL